MVVFGRKFKYNVYTRNLEHLVDLSNTGHQLQWWYRNFVIIKVMVQGETIMWCKLQLIIELMKVDWLHHLRNFREEQTFLPRWESTRSFLRSLNKIFLEWPKHPVHNHLSSTWRLRRWQLNKRISYVDWMCQKYQRTPTKELENYQHPSTKGESIIFIIIIIVFCFFFLF